MMVVATAAFPKPQPTIAYAETSSEHGDDDEDPIASINAMSIKVDSMEDAKQQQTSKTNQGNVKANGNAKVSSLRSLLGVPPSAAVSSLRAPQANAGSMSMLGVPPSTSAGTAPPGIGGASGARILANNNNQGSADSKVKTLPSEIAPRRKKVVLEPGCSALDWAHLKSSIPSQGFRKIKPSELKLHKSKDDAWSAFNGKVYDMTPYMRFHPGGQDELMRVAGRDGTKLFSEFLLFIQANSYGSIDIHLPSLSVLTHSWVNIDSMIDSCVVGVLVSESA
jgi:cytochrome b involved in lipid metabolism